MEEPVKTEQQLNEEQLQEITGGCAQCGKDFEQIEHHHTLVTAYQKLTKTAIARKKPDSADLYLKLSDGHLQAGGALLNTITTRLKIPGHRLVPGGSSDG